MLRGHLLRCSLRSSSSAEGALSVAEFAPNSATFGVWPTNGCSLSRNNILCNRFFHDVAEPAFLGARRPLWRRVGCQPADEGSEALDEPVIQAASLDPHSSCGVHTSPASLAPRYCGKPLQKVGRPVGRGGRFVVVSRRHSYCTDGGCFPATAACYRFEVS